MMRKRILLWIVAVLMVMVLAQGCGEADPAEDNPQTSGEEESVMSVDDTAAGVSEDDEREHAEEEASEPLDNLEEDAATIENTGVDAAAAEVQEEGADASLADNIPQDRQEEQENTMYLQIGQQTLTATLVENSSTEALKELLREGPVTISMRDYGNFEKVGELGATLPVNDESITTEPGDLILYQGNSFVIYYATNSWSFTRLGKINGVTEDELKEILGSGNVSVTLSLSQAS